MSKEFCLFEVNEKKVIWEVTNFCNYKCKHCCAGASIVDTSKELKLDDFKRILKELEKYGIKEIYFSGGEPFSRKDMIDIVSEAVKLGISCNISTNGSLIDNKIARQLKSLGINKVHISLDSHKESIFNDFRGGKYFIPTIKAIKLLKEHDIYVRVGTVIWSGNINDIDEMIRYLENLNVDEIVFNWLVKVGRSKNNEGIFVDIDLFDQTVEKIKNKKSKIKISMHRKNKYCNTDEICPGGEDFFYINPQGYVSPCSWINKLDPKYCSKMSLKDHSFEEIIKCNEINEFNKMKRNRNKDYKSGCPAICLERNGSYNSKDPLLKEE